MQITGGSLLSATLGRAMTDLRSSFDTLDAQLSSGKVATTYGGLGDGRTVSLAMRAQISRLQAYQGSITDVTLRVTTMNAALDGIATSASDQRSDTDANDKTIISATGQTRAGVDALTRMNDVLSALGTDINGRYLFGGQKTDTPPVAGAGEILDGTGTQVGLKGVIAERRQADLGTIATDAATGAASVGRLTVSAPTTSGGTSSVTIARDGSHPFGFQLKGGSTTMAGASVSDVSGTPPRLTIGLSQQPSEGGTLTLSVGLPDGTTSTIALTAAASPNGPDQFAIGADTATTMKNLQAAVVSHLDGAAGTDLSAASAMTASTAFFGSDPLKRVSIPAGGTAATATGLRAATPTDTVAWYKGGTSADPRGSVTTGIDAGVQVRTGVEADESGIAKVMAGLGVMAAQTYPTTKPDGTGATVSALGADGTLQDATSIGLNAAIAGRVRDALQPSQGLGSVQGIETELAGAGTEAASAKARLTTRMASAQDLVDGVETADPTQVGAQLLSVQTRLQASYQTTAMLSKLSLVNYLGS